MLKRNENYHFPYREKLESLYFKSIPEAEKVLRGSELQQQINQEINNSIQNINEVVENH